MTMKALKVADGSAFGPFTAIVQKPDRFECDGVAFPKSVVGAAAIEDWVSPVGASPGSQPTPDKLSRLQLLLGMTQAGLITEDEGVAAAAGSLVPAAVEAVFATLQGEAASEARIRWHAMTEVERANPLVIAVAAAAGKTEAQLDQLFRNWSRL